MHAVGAAQRFLVAYPEGSSWGNIPWRSWNAGACCGYAKARRVDDVAFFDALLEDLQGAFPIDVSRVYVAGVSNGAMMAYRLACERSERIAGIASVGGTLSRTPCEPSGSVSVIALHGTRDRAVPYHGGCSDWGDPNRVDRSIPEIIRFWAQHNRCQRSPQITQDRAVEITRYAECAGGAAVALHTLQGGHHGWPKRSAQRIWDFFDAQ